MPISPLAPGRSAATNSAGSNSLISVGAQGEAVTRLQQALERAGIPVPGGADGDFGPGTESAVRAFQKRAGLAVSGKADAETLQALSRAPAAAPKDQFDPAPAAPKRSGGLFGWLRGGGSPRPQVDRAAGMRIPADPEARAAELKGLVAQQGGEWRAGPNELNVVGLRGQDVEGRRHGNAFNRWNDTIAFAWRDTDGRMNVREFRGTTDPGVGRSSYGLGVDANGDGIKDVGHVQPGQYRFRNGPHRGLRGAAEGQSVTVSRDVDGDGRISAGEARDRFAAGGIDLHWGWENEETYDGRALTEEVNSSSEGCQVIAMSRGDFLKYVTPLLELNARSDFRYTLVDRTAR